MPTGQGIATSKAEAYLKIGQLTIQNINAPSNNLQSGSDCRSQPYRSFTTTLPCDAPMIERIHVAKLH